MMTMTSREAEALFEQLLGRDWRDQLRTGDASPDTTGHHVASSRHRAVLVVHRARPDIELSHADRRVIAAAWTAVGHRAERN
jgi:hypothetical protein